jgi:propanol-preferring alcohol dehydrogenase
MKVALLHKVGMIETDPLKIEDIETPKPGKGQVLVKITASGVCGSNLNMVEGDWVNVGVPPKYPIIPGHEIAGIVAEVGPGVESVRKKRQSGIAATLDVLRHVRTLLDWRRVFLLEARDPRGDSRRGFR